MCGSGLGEVGKGVGSVVGVAVGGAVRDKPRVEFVGGCG